MKIPLEYEDIVDNKFYKWSDNLSPSFKNYNFTPNMITTLGLLCTLIMIYLIFKGECQIAAIFYIVAYFFDCMDGCYARKYKMTSKYGDYYEHIVDWIRNTALILMIVYGCKCNDNFTSIIVLITLFVIENIKQAYQDKYYKVKTGRNETESLDFLQKIVSPPDDLEKLEDTIKKLTYVGWGVFTVTAAFFLFSCDDLKVDIGDSFNSIKKSLGFEKITDTKV
jgi:phosphatidylglycerophosphate synthase